MKIGLVGLGKMGLNIAMNLIRNDVEVIGYDVSTENMMLAQKQGVVATSALAEVIAKLEVPRIVWLMLPSGAITNHTLKDITAMLAPGDIVIDGGNSFYKDSIANNEVAKQRGIHFFDVGTSGGISGALNGGNFMIGGNKGIFEKIEWIFQKIAQKDGYLYTGLAGSGHYLKMVHNGIEYGMMQAIAEGFDLLEHSPYDYENEKVANLWNHGSVVRSWLMELAVHAFKEDPKLEQIKGVMYSSGEGKWTVEEALDRQVAIPVIATSLMMRYRSLENDTFTGKVVASLRKGFGGHEVASKK